MLRVRFRKRQLVRIANKFATDAEAIDFSEYDAGHMFYLNQPDLEKTRGDLVKFLTK
jgi:carboxypeptidase C (cathepsin A)